MPVLIFQILFNASKKRREKKGKNSVSSLPQSVPNRPMSQRNFLDGYPDMWMQLRALLFSQAPSFLMGIQIKTCINSKWIIVMYSVMNYVTAKHCYLEKREHSWRTATSYLNPQRFLCIQALPINSIFAKIPWRPSVHRDPFTSSQHEREWTVRSCKTVSRGPHVERLLPTAS